MNNLKIYRRDLHKIPETAFNEHKTSAYLKEQLLKIGFQPFSILSTDVLVFIDKGSKETIAFRSDIDALPQIEETNHEFKSTHDGFMHACGHDGHMSMLLTFAEYLKEHEQSITKNILLIFQPAEEAIGGAKKLLELGLFKQYNVSSVFGIHLYPELDEGVIGCKSGDFMAQANEVDVIIHGKSAHGAMPENGINANLIAANLFNDYNNIITNNLPSDDLSILSFGTIKGGTVRNIISEYCILEGTMRTFKQSSFELITFKMNEIKTKYEQIYNTKIEVIVKDGYLPVYNDPTLYSLFKEAMSEFNYHEFTKPLMIAEDFSFYQKEAPGIFFYVGIKNEKKGFIHGLHSSHFNFDEDALKLGVKAYISILKKCGAINE